MIRARSAKLSIGLISKKVYISCNAKDHKSIYINRTITKATLMSLLETISEARQGVKLSQLCLYEKLYPFARMLCLRYLKFKEDAEEVMQDGFVKFFISLKDFRYESENAFYAYVRRIMVNECLARLRKNKVFELLPESKGV